MSLQIHSSPAWRRIQRENYTSKETLADFLELSESQRSHLIVRSRFPLNLPRRLASKMAKGTLSDPLLRQFVPFLEEVADGGGGFIQDPVGDSLARCSPKLLHKYHGRALLLPTSGCAMHCRYCFRQHFDYATAVKGCSEELKLIREDPTIREVILSGGDPLSLSDTELSQLLLDLGEIPHVTCIRFHSRFPIGIPERITKELLKAFANCSKQIWFIIHCNHSLELDQEVLEALGNIQKLGIPLLCQTVLLRGVNDSVEALKQLCEQLIDHGIQPYYLHQLDRVQGASHFEVSVEEGKRLLAALRATLPGYAVPQYVQEIPGEPHKTPLI